MAAQTAEKMDSTLDAYLENRQDKKKKIQLAGMLAYQSAAMTELKMVCYLVDLLAEKSAVTMDNYWAGSMVDLSAQKSAATMDNYLAEEMVVSTAEKMELQLESKLDVCKADLMVDWSAAN